MTYLNILQHDCHQPKIENQINNFNLTWGLVYIYIFHCSSSNQITWKMLEKLYYW